MAFRSSENSFYGSNPNREGVLVTGCSTGIGRAIALHLAKKQFTVFVTVRKEADVENLHNLNEPNLIPTYPLDLTKVEQIPNVVEAVKRELILRGKEGLFAIINNAGGGFIAPLELMDLEKFRIELEARILGPVALAQAFLPMIRKSGGRILWIVTPALIPIPYVSSIHACDFAANCIARTLHIELRPWKIPNILIRCGGVKTAAPAKTGQELEECFKKWPLERLELYAQALHKQQEDLAKFDLKRTDSEEVAKVVFKALCAKKPKRRYTVAYMARAASLLEHLPQSVVDSIMARRA